MTRARPAAPASPAPAALQQWSTKVAMLFAGLFCVESEHLPVAGSSPNDDDDWNDVLPVHNPNAGVFSIPDEDDGGDDGL